jgi:hypothetical protein
VQIVARKQCAASARPGRLVGRNVSRAACESYRKGNAPRAIEASFVCLVSQLSMLFNLVLEAADTLARRPSGRSTA